MERMKTPLWALHKQVGARLIDFGGWDMPVQYTAGTIKEHQAVRKAVGLFDVFHQQVHHGGCRTSWRPLRAELSAR